MAGPLEGFDLSRMVHYRPGSFPPRELDYARLLSLVAGARDAVARYDSGLRSLHNSELLLAPLRNQEAVISSRIEGTVATLEEVLQYKAARDEEKNELPTHHAFRREIAEVSSYAMALNWAQRLVNDGLPISNRLLKETHGKLLFTGRGADKQPGSFKTDQNYIVDQGRRQILFVPISPQRLNDGMKTLEGFIHDQSVEPLLATALAHAEFEALHPFKDGNGRIGRMLITLMLWDKGLISAPHFYVSGVIEQRKEEYIDRLRTVSAEEDWTGWCMFFLEAVLEQAEQNLEIIDEIKHLYEEMKERFRVTLSSQWSMHAVDFVFGSPIFRAPKLAKESGIPRPTASRFLKLLTEQELVTLIIPASGRRPAAYAFEPLLRIVRR